MQIRGNFFINAINHGQTGTVTFTFDDGPDPIHTPAVLDVLKAHSIKATFFCIGSKVKEHPEIIERMVAEDHTVANHTHSHSYYWGFLSESKVTKEIEQTSLLIKEITGNEPRYFRPPFGVTNPQIARSIKKLGYQCIGWDVRSLDTLREPMDKVVQRVAKKLQNGSILLFHDNLKNCPMILEEVIQLCKAKQKSIVSLEESITPLTSA